MTKPADKRIADAISVIAARICVKAINAALSNPVIIAKFNPKKRTAKCAVKDCENRTGQGHFNGFLCTPCHQFVSGEGGLNSKAYRNAQEMIDLAIHKERGRVAKFLERLDMKAQPYNGYYKHAAKVINGSRKKGHRCKTGEEF